MAEHLTSQDILASLRINSNDQTNTEVATSGVLPLTITEFDVKKTVTIMGITPEDFVKEYSSMEFDFDKLCAEFGTYCKDFSQRLQDGVKSKALEFSTKILFKYGPYIRTERKSKGNKAVRFKFPYTKTDKDVTTHEIKVVIVTTSNDLKYIKSIIVDKMVLTFRQAALLAMVTFTKVMEYCYNKSAGSKLLTPLCRTIFSRDSIEVMATELKMEEVAILQMINESSTSGGQYLEHSDLACAAVCMISSTKKVTDSNVRDLMISKVVKQYIHKNKQFDSGRFSIFAKYALGEVPQGLDAESFIATYKDIQTAQISARRQSQSIRETLKQVAPEIGHSRAAPPFTNI